MTSMWGNLMTQAQRPASLKLRSTEAAVQAYFFKCLDKGSKRSCDQVRLYRCPAQGSEARTLAALVNGLFYSQATVLFGVAQRALYNVGT